MGRDERLRKARQARQEAWEKSEEGQAAKKKLHEQALRQQAAAGANDVLHKARERAQQKLLGGFVDGWLAKDLSTLLASGSDVEVMAYALAAGGMPHVFERGYEVRGCLAVVRGTLKALDEAKADEKASEDPQKAEQAAADQRFVVQEACRLALAHSYAQVDAAKAQADFIRHAQSGVADPEPVAVEHRVEGYEPAGPEGSAEQRLAGYAGGRYRSHFTSEGGLPPTPPTAEGVTRSDRIDGREDAVDADGLVQGVPAEDVWPELKGVPVGDALRPVLLPQDAEVENILVEGQATSEGEVSA